MRLTSESAATIALATLLLQGSAPAPSEQEIALNYKMCAYVLESTSPEFDGIITQELFQLGTTPPDTIDIQHQNADGKSVRVVEQLLYVFDIQGNRIPVCGK